MARNLFSQSGTPNDFILEVLAGNIPGYTLINVLGNNDALSGAPAKTLWDDDSDYITPLVAAATTIESSDNVADLLAGTGLQKAEVFYLDSNFEEQSEVIDMNGSTPVPLSENAIAVNSILATQVGSGGFNVGQIKVEIGGNPAAFIRALENRSDGGVYTVPSGFSVIGNAPSYAASASTEADAFIKFRNGETGIFFRRKLLSVFENSLVANILPVIKLEEKSVIVLQGIKLSGLTPKLSGLVQLLKINNEDIS